MLAVFNNDGESSSLYFKLNNSLHLLSPQSSATYKIAGVYAIYKGGVCYYVGQSKNIPSRIATHLSGKYENADRVKIFFAGETEGLADQDCNFYDWPKSEQADALEANEAVCISLFKPIENIKIPVDSDGDNDWFITPEVESARIDKDGRCFSVYRDPYDIGLASDTLEERISHDKKSLGGA